MTAAADTVTVMDSGMLVHEMEIELQNRQNKESDVQRSRRARMGV